MARANDPDPIARESTRLCAAVGFIAQTSLEPSVIAQWIGPKVFESPMIFRAAGAENAAAVAQPSPSTGALLRTFSPINYLDASDPPVLVIYAAPPPLPARTAADAIHHAAFGLHLKEKADAVGARVTLCIDGEPLGDESARMQLLYKFSRDFIAEHLRSPRR